MASTAASFIFLLFIFIFSDETDSQFLCQTTSCGGDNRSPPIRFPFRLNFIMDPRCGYRQEFDLKCNNRNQAILTLPFAGEFAVRFIDYGKQRLWINDPDNCLSRRFLEESLDLQNYPFQFNDRFRNFTFLNCPYYMKPSPIDRFWKINCMSGDNYTVVAMASRDYPTVSETLAKSCNVMAMKMLPLRGMRFEGGEEEEEGIALKWSEPDCANCEARGGDCGLKRDSIDDVQCFNLPKSRLSRGAKYGLIIGVGIPGLLFLCGLGCCIGGKFRALARPNHPNTTVSFSMGHRPSSVAAGLDGPTIESFPKTLLGESRRLPKPNDNTCSICLSEYQPKEVIRTIPECSHYFHANCIDEWLKLNPTCPVCRNSPEDSSVTTTPLSSVSLSSSTSSS